MLEQASPVGVETPAGVFVWAGERGSDSLDGDLCEEVPDMKPLLGYGQWKNDPSRLGSPEKDFGSWWTFLDRRRPRWRVSWIARTGELYAVQVAAPHMFIELGVFTREELEAKMEGWKEHYRLEWVMGSVPG
jgi:hypothetical protein